MGVDLGNAVASSTHVRSLLKVDVLTERSKNTGVIFQQVAFSSEAEFSHWYANLNPSGSGLTAFVVLVSIWTFASVDQIDTSQWLNEIHRSKAVGLKGGNADTVRGCTGEFRNKIIS